MHLTIPHFMSTIMMKPTEVKRMALAAIADIERQRSEKVQEAIEASFHMRDSKLFGLFRPRIFKTRDQAIDYSPLVHSARNYLSCDLEVCKDLLDMADYLIDNDNTRMMTITAADFGSLTL
jgi:hypothetical protein